MSTTLIEVRPAKAADATAVASTHDEAWRAAYQGIIPGAELDLRRRALRTHRCEYNQSERRVDRLHELPEADGFVSALRIRTANQIRRIFP